MRKESSIEKAFARLAEKLFSDYGLPFKYIKTTTPGRKGWPDRLLLFGPDGHHLYIEWKRPGQEPDPMQVIVHNEIRALGAEVRWYDDHYIALVEVEAFVRAKTGANPWDEADCPEWWSQIVLKARKRKNISSPKIVRSPKENGSSGRPPSPRAVARDHHKLALRDEQMGGLSPSPIRDDPWGEDRTFESDEHGRGCILDEYRGITDD